MGLHHANNSPILRGMVYLPRGVGGGGGGKDSCTSLVSGGFDRDFRDRQSIISGDSLMSRRDSGATSPAAKELQRFRNAIRSASFGIRFCRVSCCRRCLDFCCRESCVTLIEAYPSYPTIHA